MDSYKEDLDKQMMKFFPSIWNDFKGLAQIFALPIFTKRLNQEEALFNKSIINLTTEIRLNSMTQVNAYTYPWIDSTIEAQLASIPWIGDLVGIIEAIRGLKQHNNLLQYKTSNNRVIFPKSNLKMLFFTTKGTLHRFTPEERLAIYLHEIGHWAYIYPVASMGLFNFAKKIIKKLTVAGGISIGAIIATKGKYFKLINNPLGYIAVALLLISCLASIISARAAEWQADKYVKEVGYNEYLISAFEKMMTVRQNAGWYVKMNDWIGKWFLLIHNTIDKFLPVTSHPGTKRRIAAISDGVYLSENVLLMNITTKIFNKIDSSLAGKMHLLFPYKD